MSMPLFLNLPVRDLAAATRFYEAIGCRQNAQFSDENASSMVWSDTFTFQLLTHAYFATFLAKPIADAQAATAFLMALSAESREAVDAIVEAGAAAGGKADPRPVSDMGWMYNRAVEDPDGHTLEVAWMDVAAFSASQEG